MWASLWLADRSPGASSSVGPEAMGGGVAGGQREQEAVQPCGAAIQVKEQQGVLLRLGIKFKRLVISDGPPVSGSPGGPKG